MLVFGPSYAKIFSAGLLFIPKLNVYENPLYTKTLRTMIEWSNLATLFQIFLNLFTLVDSVFIYFLLISWKILNKEQL
jgi:hypothetical protein